MRDGDRAKVRLSDDDLPIAIRKFCEGSSPIANTHESLSQYGTILGTLSRIVQEQSLYVFKTKTDDEKSLTTNPDTLINESAQVGDEVNISAANEDQAIAIRKKRDAD